jgi:hypothetical protein
MTITKTYPFTTDTNYTYDPLKVVITNGEASLLDLGGGTYATDNPTIVFNDELPLDELQSFIETSTKAGLDEVKFTLSKEGVEYYYSGSWVVSNGTYTEANLASEIETNKASFTSLGTITSIKMFLHSDDGTTTPSVDLISVDYNFVPVEETIPTTLLYWYAKHTNAADDTAIATIELTNSVVKYGIQTTITKEAIEIQPNRGLYQVEIVDTQNMETDASSNQQTYTLVMGGQTFTLHIPALDSVNLYDSGIIV